MYGIVWPAIPDTSHAATLAIRDELERTQWWTPAELADRQRAQRDLIVAHAAASVPHYRDIDPRDWASVPVMTRAAITDAGAALLSRKYPATHGPADEISTSRTSGAPVLVRNTAVIGALWRAITLRDHAWHRRDLNAHLAAIRYVDGVAGRGSPPAGRVAEGRRGSIDARAPDGARGRGWGVATEELAPDAPLSVLTIHSTTDEQLAWLVRTQPTYLIAYPTVLAAILHRVIATGTTRALPSLREVRTISEILPAATRALCREVLGVPIVDTYSAQEVGYIALQCPDHEHYHVQAERLIVEILRDDDTPCALGETGRVVVTDLHNFATPILRYDIGDYAEVGAPCACGRGLPVLTRIIGRRRNMLVYPDGRTIWPVFTIGCREAARYRDLQLVQRADRSLHVRVVPDGDAAVDRTALIAALRRMLGPFEIDAELVDAIGRTSAGKLEEFVSHAVIR